MILKRTMLILTLVAASSLIAFAAGPPDDPIGAQLFPPELLMQNREELGLTPQQVERIRAFLERPPADAADRQQQVEAATRKLAELLSAEEINEAAALGQLDELLAAEKELKRRHLQLMIRIRSELTAEQRQRAAKLRRDPNAEGLEQRLRSKLARIEQEVQRRARAGQPPFEAVQQMQAFQQEMQAARHKEAEAVLDRVLNLLEAGEQNDPAEKKQNSSTDDQQGHHPPAAPPTISQLPAAKPLSLQALKTQVDGLRVPSVAWRKIDWNTCLLQGLKESREQHKPIVLWVFIDRPIDDERC